MPDNHPLSVGAARSHALQNADVVVLMGARLNWIMHFGLPPRFNKNVRIIQLDISPEQIGQNVPTEVGAGRRRQGDRRAAQRGAREARVGLSRRTRRGTRRSPTKIGGERGADRAPARRRRGADQLLPRAQGHRRLDRRTTRSSSARARTRWTSAAPSCSTAKPRHRLDAGSYGTMGVGMGFVIAAAVVHPDKPIVSVSGDSAFGFSGMEMETVCRYQLPVKIVVFNNGGIGPGHAEHAGRPAPEHAAERADLWRALRQDDGGVRRQGLLHRGSEGPEGRPAGGDGLPRPGARQRRISQESARKPQQFRWHS